MNARLAIFAATLLFAGLPLVSGGDAEIKSITATELHGLLSSEGAEPLLVDVREPHEFEAVHIEGALLAPLGNVEKDLEKIAKDRDIVLVCRTGRRSGIAWQRLAARGFTQLRNLEGGMVGWEKLGYPVVRKK